MGKVSFVSELIVKEKTKLVCENCGKEIQLSIDDDGYIHLPTGGLRMRCPLCNQEYEILFDYEMIKKEKNNG